MPALRKRLDGDDNGSHDSRVGMPPAICTVVVVHGLMEPVATLDDGRRWFYCNGCSVLRSPSVPRVLDPWHPRY